MCACPDLVGTPDLVVTEEQDKHNTEVKDTNNADTDSNKKD